MADKKVVFIAFAIEDETQRDFLKGQSLHPRIYRYVSQGRLRQWLERKGANPDQAVSGESNTAYLSQRVNIIMGRRLETSPGIFWTRRFAKAPVTFRLSEGDQTA